MVPVVDTSQRVQPVWPGIVSAVLGGVALASFLWVWVLSSTSVDPPGWARIAGSVPLPFAVGGAIGAAVIARHGPGRRWAELGLAAVALSVLGVVVLAVVYE